MLGITFPLLALCGSIFLFIILIDYLVMLMIPFLSIYLLVLVFEVVYRY